MTCEKHSLEAPGKTTAAASSFFESFEKDSRFFNFVFDSVYTCDYIKFKVEKVFAGEPVDGTLTPDSLARTKPGPYVTKFRTYMHQLLEMLISRIVDNFQTYLVDILREILHKKPDILRSGDLRSGEQTVPLSEVLSSSSLDALIHSLVEKKVTSLSNVGFDKLHEWFTKQKIPLIVASADRPAIVELIAIRNLIVHNRCRVDEKHKRIVRTCNLAIGELHKLDGTELDLAWRVCWETVIGTDRAIVNKFGLNTSEYAEPCWNPYLRDDSHTRPTRTTSEGGE